MYTPLFRDYLLNGAYKDDLKKIALKSSHSKTFLIEELAKLLTIKLSPIVPLELKKTIASQLP